MWILIPLGILSLALLLWRSWRSREAGIWLNAGLSLIRVGALLWLFLLLLGPSRVPIPEANESVSSELHVLVDHSASMLADDMGGTSRWHFALTQWLRPKLLKQWSEHAELQLHLFDSALQPAELSQFNLEEAEDAFGAETRLMHALNQALQELPEGSQLLLLSDGHDSLDDSPVEVLKLAEEKAIRIHAVPLGGPRLEQDLHVLGVPNQPFLVAGEEGGLRIQVMHSNAKGERSLLRVSDDSGTRSFPVEFGEGPYAEVQLPIRHDQPGSYSYVLEVEALEHEIEKRNNHQTVMVDVIPERFRVLMLEGKPFWDSKFIAQTLRKDGRLELMQVSQISEGRQEMLVTRIPKGRQSFPESVEDLAEFDLIILGRDIEKVTGRKWLSLLPDYVSQQGGRLLFSRGRAFDVDAVRDRSLRERLRMLEPVNLTDTWMEEVSFTPRANEWGHPVFSVPGLDAAQLFPSLPTLSYARVSEAGPGSRVMAEFQSNQQGERYPAMVSQSLGAGQTLMLLGDGLWRWRMPGPHANSDITFYEQFWSNSVRWMLSSGSFKPGSELNLELSSRHLRLGSELQVTLQSRLPLQERFPTQLEVEAPDGSRQRRSFSLSTPNSVSSAIAWSPEQSGVYTLRVEAPGMNPERLEARVNVYDLDMERLQNSSRPDVLRLLSRESGGTFLDPYLPQALPKHAGLQTPLDPETLPPEYIWQRGSWMVWLLLLFGMEWILRKRWGWSA